MLQKMLRFRPRVDESKEDFMIRVNCRLKHIKQLHRVIAWDILYHRSVFKWAGHVVRIQQYDAARLTHKVLAHKCWRWIQTVARQNRGNQLHGRRLRTWRWERPLYKYLGDECWETAAQDKLEWNSKLDAMTEWRRTHR